MTVQIRDGNYDVAILAGPRLDRWPSIGAKVISKICSEAGLMVGQLGGPTIQPRGLLPLPGTGGVILAEDAQRRVHRIRSKSVVMFESSLNFPEPFVGWRSEGLVPLETAVRLLPRIGEYWTEGVAILGTGNDALRFGSELLNSSISTKVVCIELRGEWGKKNYAGWELERRNFEVLGGKVIHGKPIELVKKSAQSWELKLQDPFGVRVLRVALVVSAGPFVDERGYSEYPSGSFLFRIDQIAAEEKEFNIEGWNREAEQSKEIASRIVRGLSSSDMRTPRSRIKSLFRYREKPFELEFDGKWLSTESLKEIRKFPGSPQTDHFKKRIAVLECIEDIECDLCQTACPEDAIEIKRSPKKEERKFLVESKCTGCGACMNICPANAVVMLQENEGSSFSPIYFDTHSYRKVPDVGDPVLLLNRRGDEMGRSRVTEVTRDWLKVDVPIHLLWQVRGIQPVVKPEELIPPNEFSDGRVKVSIEGRSRLVKEGETVSQVLFASGIHRPSDALDCPDGSCGLCVVSIDGSKKKACQTLVSQGMTIGKLESDHDASSDYLCPCLRIQSQDVIDRIQKGKLKTPEAIVGVTGLGSGTCHGQICSSPFKRLLQEQGIDASGWVDWRFPLSDWVIYP